MARKNPTKTKNALNPDISREEGESNRGAINSNRKLAVINALASGIHLLAIVSGMASSVCLLDLLADARHESRPHHSIKITSR